MTFRRTWDRGTVDFEKFVPLSGNEVSTSVSFRGCSNTVQKFQHKLVVIDDDTLTVHLIPPLPKSTARRTRPSLYSGIDTVSYGHPRETKPTRGAAAPAGVVMVVASLVGVIGAILSQFCANLVNRPRTYPCKLSYCA